MSELISELEAKQILRRINELHYELHPEPLTELQIRSMRDELMYKLAGLKDAGYGVGLIRADFVENCGRYVFLDAIE